jgi:transposase
MPILAESIDALVGVDTHLDTHTAVVLNPLGAVLAEVTVDTTPTGLARLLAFATDYAPGQRLAWVVEGTRSHGAGLLRVLRAAGQRVIEAPRASRKSRRGGKSDPLDAIAAGRAALGNHHHAQPRIDGVREDLRILLASRTHLTTARTATVNLIKALLVTGEVELREQTRGLNTTAQIRYLANLPWLRSSATGEHIILFRELRAHAKAVLDLDARIADNHVRIESLVQAVMPALLDESGVGPVNAAVLLVSWSHAGRFPTEAAFASSAGVSPLEASSGRNQRHRLNRSGDRRLNSALHSIAMTRARCHPPTRTYTERRRADGKNPREIRRCLKRYLARHLYRLMETNAPQTPA